MRLLLALALLLAACTEATPVPTPSPEPEHVAPPTSEVATTPSPEPAPQESPTGQPFPANTATDTGEGGGEPLVVTGVRLTAEDGFDRIVMDLEGSGTPGWTVGYVDEPLGQGDGARADVTGDAYLEVLVSNVTYPSEATAPAGTLRADGTRAMVEVTPVGVFEGVYQAFVGLRATVPFRVYGLDEPPRVVIEAVHP